MYFFTGFLQFTLVILYILYCITYSVSIHCIYNICISLQYPIDKVHESMEQLIF